MATIDRTTLNVKISDTLRLVKQNPIPKHIAIIMDGNGRWAKHHGKDRTAGHRQGVDTARDLVEFCIDHLNLEVLTLFAFSTENWFRPRREVDFLMDLLQRFLREQVDRLVRRNVRLRVLGDVTELPESLQHEIHRAIDQASQNTGLQLNLAVNYGGRQEILRATRLIAEAVRDGKFDVGDIDESVFAKALYTDGLPDPDLFIRTAEQRLSNFMLWQAAYAEFWTTHTPWPDFTIELFLKAIQDFQRRQRTFGGLKAA